MDFLLSQRRFKADCGRLAIALASLLALISLPIGAQERLPAQSSPEGETQFLVLGHPVDRELMRNAADDYRLILLRGQFVRLTIEQDNTSDVLVTLFEPDGDKVLEASNPDGLQFPLYWIAADSGVYRLDIRHLPNSDARNHYRLRVEELKEATDQDRTRFEASQALTEARRLSEQSSSDAAQQAVEKYQESISHFQAANDHSGEAYALVSLGYCYWRAQDYRRGIDYFEQARSLWHALAESRMEASTLEAESAFYGALGQSQEVLDLDREVLALWQSLGDRRRQAETLDAIAGDLGDLGEYQDALNFYDQALSICRGEPSWPAELQYGILGNIGDFYGQFGDNQRALDYYGHALDLARATGNRTLQADMLQLIGATYEEAGDKDHALASFRDSLALARELRDPGGESFVMNRLGNFYVRQGQYGKALDYFNQAFALFKRPMSLYGMGIVYHKQGELKRALDVLNQALSQWPFTNYIKGELLQEIGDVYEQLGERPKALEFLNKSLAESRDAKDSGWEVLALCDIARVERAAGDLSGARRDIETGLGIQESFRYRISGSEQRANYFARAKRNYEFYIDLLMQMNSEQPDQGFAAAALQASERARARSLLDVLVEAHTDIRQGADPKLLEQERILQQRLQARSEHQIALLTRAHTPEQVESMTRELRALTAEYEDVEAHIRTTSPRYAALTQPEPLNLEQIQNRLLDRDTLLLEYVLGEGRSYVWAVTPSTFAAFTLPKRADIEGAARGVYALLTAPDAHPKGESELARQARVARARAEYPRAASRLSEMVLGPVASLLGDKRLLIVSDGALQYIPFEALPVPKQASGRFGQPIVVEHEIVNAPSASTVAALRREVTGRQVPPKAVAVLADPVFDEEDSRVSEARQARTIRQTAKPSSPDADFPPGLKRSLAEVGLAESGWRIPRLSFSRREAEAIMANASQGEGMEAVDFRASREMAMSSALRQYRIVHFATHGILDSQTPALSGIVFSLVDPQGKPENGFLRLFEIYNLDLPADLVVLSACQTALGKEIEGEGLVGLTRGFMYAGASRVMASLWEVNDAATSELMARFYKAMLKDHLRPAAALRVAQIQMWRQQRWQ